MRLIAAAGSKPRIHHVLSDQPWSLVESIPRVQGSWDPSRLGTQPSRSQDVLETGWIETDFPTSHAPSAPRFLGFRLYWHRGLQKAGNQHAQDSLPPWHNGSQKPWDPVASSGKAPGDPVASSGKVPGDHGSRASPWIREPRSTDIQRSRSPRRQVAGKNLVPFTDRLPWSMVLIGGSSTQAPRPPTYQWAASVMVPNFHHFPRCSGYLDSRKSLVSSGSMRDTHQGSIDSSRPRDLGHLDSQGTRNRVDRGRSTSLIPGWSRHQQSRDPWYHLRQ